MKDNTYNIKHDFCDATITYPKEGIPIKLNINMTFQTFTYLFMMIGLIGLIVCDLVEMVVK